MCKDQINLCVRTIGEKPIFVEISSSPQKDYYINHQATITWSHNGTNTRDGVTADTTYTAPDTTSTLTIPQTTVTDRGDYVCSIEFDDQTSTITGSAQLNLNCESPKLLFK